MRLNKESAAKYLEKISDFSTPDRSFSPFYSNIGLVIRPGGKELELWLHYNRASRLVWGKLFDLGLPQNGELSSPDRLVLTEDGKKAEISFFGADSLIADFRTDRAVGLFEAPGKGAERCWAEKWDEKLLLLRGFSANADDRDPDETVPVCAGVKLIHGRLTEENGAFAAEPEEGRVTLAAVFEFLETDSGRVLAKLENAPGDIEKAVSLCGEMITDTFKDLDTEVKGETEAELAAKALLGLAFNMAKAPGELKYHISSFPSRGAYPTHFLWDTCFQNLAYEELNPKLAEEFLLQFAHCQRVDGKYVQFICSTWGRPHYSQPALVGWATLRAYEKTGNTALLEVMLPSLEKNNDWWLTARGSEKGLIFCDHGLETGQDDSPRFDNGATYACDMNSYVLNQLGCTAKICDILGEEARAEKWRKAADRLSSAMIKYLYDEDENIFFDLHPVTGERVKIVSPVSFLPLWAGAALPEEKARESIEKCLLDPERLFGEVPFPSVAYDEPSYKSDAWWRGPTWMPNAWLMLETLGKFGFTAEKKEAEKRLLRVLLEDREMHELFDSKNGKGLGASQQGWTNAIFLKLLIMN